MITTLKEFNIITQKNKINPNVRLILNKHIHLLQLIKEAKPIIDINRTDWIKRKLYCILHNLQEEPTCKLCNGSLPFRTNGYPTFCSRSCNMKYNSIGNINHNKRIHKTKQTNLKKYGCEFPLSNSKVREKGESTRYKKYGERFPGSVPDFHEKRKQTNLKIYGHECSLLNGFVMYKSFQTRLNKYNRKFVHQTHIDVEVLEKLNNKDWLYMQHVDLKKPLSLIANELQVAHSTVQRHVSVFDIPIQRFMSSIGENQVKQFIRDIGIYNFVENDRQVIKPLELDIFIPSLCIAIEYNGDYWHGNTFPETQQRDKIKMKMCNNLNITLIIITEQDWINNNDTVKHMLIEKLNTK